VALPAFAAERRAVAAAPLLLLSAGARCTIDIFCRPGAQQQTRRNSVWRANNGTDGRTDKRTDRRTSDRYIDSAAYYASSINNPGRLKPTA